MKNLSINIIGAGRLGKTLGKLISLRCGNNATIQDICNLSLETATPAVTFIGSGKAHASIASLSPADLTFITVHDDAIQKVCEQLAKLDKLRPGNIIVHCSGSLPAAILNSAQEQQCHIASIHPQRSFADPELSVKQFKGTYCALEGDHEACSIVEKLFFDLGAITFPINPNKKTIYHAAGVFASNYLVTLAHAAQQCLLAANIDKEVAHGLIINLLESTVANLKSTDDIAAALTGPIKRGDNKILEKHLTAIEIIEDIEDIENAQLQRVYKHLGKLALNLTELDPSKKAELNQTLSAS